MKSTTQLIFVLLMLILSNCGIYSYTSEMRVSTISVSRIKNNIKAHSPTIDYEITKKLEEKLNQQVDLQLVEKNGDLKMSGSILDYTIKPFSLGANDKVYLNRVTIWLQMKLINRFEENKVTSKKIIAFADYDAQKNFGEVKDSINNLLSEKVAEKVYNEFFLRW